MRRLVRFAALAVAIAALPAACGSRTALLETQIDYVSGPTQDSSITMSQDVTDGTILPDDSSLLFEGGALDVKLDCALPPVCDPADPGYVYQCGQRIFQCSSLEQCEMSSSCTGGDGCGASCVNPCMDTLGQNTSNGCDFFPVEVDTANEVAGACFAVFIINQWSTGQPAKIQLDIGGQIMPIDSFTRIPVGNGTNVSYAPYDSTVGLPQNQIAILFLSRDPAALDDPTPNDPRVLANCPPGVIPAIVGDAALHGTGIGQAFHIATNVPVVAYQMLPYGGGSARVTGATLLLPTNAWDTNYVAVNAYPTWTLGNIDRSEPTLEVIAQEDGTHVTIDPTTTIFAEDGGGIPGSPAGVPVTYTINRGQYLQVSQIDEITGSPIVADKPVGVIGGSTLLDIPVTQTQRADGAEQMIPPVHALGSEYVAVRYRSRPFDQDSGVPANTEEPVPWRIVGAVDGTVLTYDPPQPPPEDGGAPPPTFLNAKQLAEFWATGPFVVRSQDAAHPFYVASYMTGGFPFDGDGDPEFVNVVPPAQYLPRYTFFTDPTYPETNLVLVRSRDPATGLLPDVTLDCAGLVSGWTPVDMMGKYEFTRLDLSTGDFQGQNGCDNGVHTIAGTFPGGSFDATGSTPAFGVTVWGWGNDITLAADDETSPLFTRWVSYGYPAGANFKQLNDVVVPAQ